jgi:hypothetical protein
MSKLLPLAGAAALIAVMGADTDSDSSEKGALPDGFFPLGDIDPITGTPSLAIPVDDVVAGEEHSSTTTAIARMKDTIGTITSRPHVSANLNQYSVLLAEWLQIKDNTIVDSRDLADDIDSLFIRWRSFRTDNPYQTGFQTSLEDDYYDFEWHSIPDRPYAIGYHGDSYRVMTLLAAENLVGSAAFHYRQHRRFFGTIPTPWPTPHNSGLSSSSSRSYKSAFKVRVPWVTSRRLMGHTTREPVRSYMPHQVGLLVFENFVDCGNIGPPRGWSSINEIDYIVGKPTVRVERWLNRDDHKITLWESVGQDPIPKLLQSGNVFRIRTIDWDEWLSWDFAYVVSPRNIPERRHYENSVRILQFPFWTSNDDPASQVTLLYPE